MPPLVRVIADDLTGAADTAVAFARPGNPVRMLLDPGDLRWRTEENSGVLAVDTDGRDAEADEVQDRYARLASAGASTPHYYVKIDSALRGSVAAAVAGTHSVLTDRLVVCAPAFPAAGRTTRCGVQYVHGVPLDRSDLWSRQVGRPPGSVTAALGRLDVVSVDLATVRSPALAARLESVDDRSVVTCDAETQDDLDAIVATTLATGRSPVWVGSGGLAAALAEALGTSASGTWTATSAGKPSGPHDVGDRRFLGVIGSAAPIAQLQSQALADRGAESIVVPVDLLLRASPTERAGQARRIRNAAARGNLVVSLSGSARPECARRIAHRLAGMTADAAAEAELLLLTGGSTARAVLLAGATTSIDIVRQLEPGVVLSVTNARAGTHIVTKAGAFGDEHSLARAARPACVG